MDPLPQENQIDPSPSSPQRVPNLEEGPLKKSKKEKKQKVSKGVETLFRTTLSNHIKLSEMADRKANLMISINTIIISITLSAYVRKFDVPANLLIPTLLLLAVCLVTIIVSLVATKPTIAPASRQPNAPENIPVDLLFFGDYTQFTAEEYRYNLRKLLRNEDDLYNSLIDNVYAQGQVLARKYRLLKFAYQFFMIGFPAAVIVAAISLFLIT